MEGLHDTGYLGKYVIVKQSEPKIKIPKEGQHVDIVSLPDLIQALPSHTMACLLGTIPEGPAPAGLPGATDAHITSIDCFQYVSRALSLLATLCEIASGHTLLSTLLLDPPFRNQVIDAACLALATVAGPEAATILKFSTNSSRMSEAITRASLVPSALKVLTYCLTIVSPEGHQRSSELNWDAICLSILKHPRGPSFLDISFESIRTVVRAVREALLVNADNVYDLAFHAGAAFEMLSFMAATPAFYHRLMMHDASGAAPLRLIACALATHHAPLAAPPFKRQTQAVQSETGQSAGASANVLVATLPPYTTKKGQGAAELLAARGFNLLLVLGDHEDPTYTDALFTTPRTRSLAEDVINSAASYMGQTLLRPSITRFPTAPGESQMSINTLRAAELLSDDSNFRTSLIPGIAPTIATMLAADPEEFKSMWCAGKSAIDYHSNGSIVVNNLTDKGLTNFARLTSAARMLYASPAYKHLCTIKKGEKVKTSHILSLERSLLLAKVIVNLHYHDNTLPAELKDKFFITLMTLLASQGIPVLTKAVDNLKALFEVACLFSGPKPQNQHQLFKDVDVFLANDLLRKIEACLRSPLEMSRPAVEPGTRKNKSTEKPAAEAQPKQRAQYQQPEPVTRSGSHTHQQQPHRLWKQVKPEDPPPLGVDNPAPIPETFRKPPATFVRPEEHIYRDKQKNVCPKKRPNSSLQNRNTLSTHSDPGDEDSGHLPAYMKSNRVARESSNDTESIE